MVACDGIFERLENADVFSIIQQGLKESSDPMATVESLLFRSLESGSKDNMTACFILLSPLPSYVSKPEMFFGPIHPQDENFMLTYVRFAEDYGFGEECKNFIVKWHQEHGSTPAANKDDKTGVEDAFIRQLLWSRNPVFLGDDGQLNGGDAVDRQMIAASENSEPDASESQQAPAQPNE